MTREQIWTLRLIAASTLIFILVALGALVLRIRDVFF